jgi:predicted Zn-ribbon and HTH transcriptional regulator
LDSRALFEIEKIVRREQAKFRHIPLVCRNCSNEMEVKLNLAICWQCRIIHPFK